jgi:hypothetical protein
MICNPCQAANNFIESCNFRAPGGAVSTIFFAHACEIDSYTVDTHTGKITSITMDGSAQFRKLTAITRTIDVQGSQLPSGALQESLTFQVGMFSDDPLRDDAAAEAVRFYQDLAQANNDFVFIVEYKGGVRYLLGFVDSAGSLSGMERVTDGTAATLGVNPEDIASYTLNFVGPGPRKVLDKAFVIPVLP